MASVTPSAQAAGVGNFASGSFTSDNTATTVTLGFVPRRFFVVNSTDNITWEKIAGMAASDCVKMTSSAQSIDTGSAILINTGATTNGTVTLSTTLVGNSKAIAWTAHG